MNKVIMSVALLLISGSTSYAADEAKPIRVIPITREAADASAAILANAKNPTIGVQPQGQQVMTRIGADAEKRVARTERVREAHAQVQNEAVVTPAPERRQTRAVNVISPTTFGRFAVRVYEVSSAH
jgi:hypothetical protein